MAQRTQPPRFIALPSRGLIAVTLLLPVQFCLAATDEFSTFRLTGIDGHVSIGYVGDDYTTETPGGGGSTVTSKQSQSDLRVDTMVMTHSYLYHPKFISMDVGAGPVFEWVRDNNNGVTTRSNHTLYNLSAHARVLPDKPYNGSLFYDHLNPTLSIGIGEIINQEADKYGFTFALLAPVTPIPLTLDANRKEYSGSSASRVIDDSTQQVTLRTNFSPLRGANTALSLHQIEQTSNSGALSQPIQESQLTTRGFNSDTSLYLGAANEVSLFNSISYSTHKFKQALASTPQIDDLRFALTSYIAHSKTLSSTAIYSYNLNRQDSRDTTAQLLNLIGNWTPKQEWVVSVGLLGESSEADQFSTRNWKTDGRVQYERPLPIGTLQTGYSLRYGKVDQSASGGGIVVVGEHVILNGTTPVNLSQPQVVGGSVSVWNLARTQQFVEGIDYTLSVVGLSTRIQRLPSGAIGDGEEVLVDYQFDVGGTYTSTSLDQDFNLNWAISRNVSAYFRYTSSQPEVDSGTPSSPLNTVHSSLYGARADVPLHILRELVVVGGLVEYENRRETHAPFVRKAGELYLQTDLPWLSNASIRLGTRRTQVDADNVAQTMDQQSYDLTTHWRTSAGLNVSLIGLFEEDNAGLQPTSRRLVTLRANWQYRKLTMIGDLTNTYDAQGDYTYDRTVGRLTMRRDF